MSNDSEQGIPKRDSEDIKIIKQTITLTERKRFLEGCMKKQVLLPSNQRNNVHFDLLLVQQSRKLKLDIATIKDKLNLLLQKNKIHSEKHK